MTGTFVQSAPQIVHLPVQQQNGAIYENALKTNMVPIQQILQAPQDTLTLFQNQAARFENPIVRKSLTQQTTFLTSPRFINKIQTQAGYPISIYQLQNGHKIFIEQRPTDVVSLRTFIRAGSINENAIYNSPLYQNTGFPSGIAHFDEHAHFVKTKNFPKASSWDEVVDQYGARTNASTDHEFIQHEVHFNRQDLDQIIQLHGESVTRPLYDKYTLNQESANVINEGKERSYPSEDNFNKSMELLFDRPNFQTLGSETDILATTVQDMQKFFDTFYVPNNMSTVISGNINPEQVAHLLNQQFGTQAPRVSPLHQNALKIALKPNEIRSATIFDPELNYSILNFTFPAPPRNNVKERVAMEMLGYFLDDGPLSLLENELKEKRNLVTDIGAQYRPFHESGLARIILHTKPGMESKAQQALINLLSAIPYYLMSSPQKLQQIQSRLKQTFQRDVITTSTGSMVIGSEAMSSIGAGKHDPVNSLSYYSSYNQIVDSITPQDIITVARKYLSPNRYAFVLSLPGSTRAESKNISSISGVLN